MQKWIHFNLLKKGKGSPYSITERRVPELIQALRSQPAGDVNHKADSRLPLLSIRPAVTPLPATYITQHSGIIIYRTKTQSLDWNSERNVNVNCHCKDNWLLSHHRKAVTAICLQLRPFRSFVWTVVTKISLCWRGKKIFSKLWMQSFIQWTSSNFIPHIRIAWTWKVHKCQTFH